METGSMLSSTFRTIAQLLKIAQFGQRLMKVYIRIEDLRFSLKTDFNLNNEIIKVKAESPRPPQTILIMMDLVS